MNKHEAKTRETRGLLLQAAKTVFVQKGYAGTELGEVAALAGRTKGAIYAQFKSKEDIFLALVEEHALHYRADMEEALAESTGVLGNREAFRQLCLHMAADTNWNLLMLEFKLFAIRNPAARKRFQAFITKLISPQDEARLCKLLGKEPSSHHSLQRTLAVQLMQPLLASLALEGLFDPEIITDSLKQTAASRLFDAIVGEPEVAAETRSTKAAATRIRNGKGPSIANTEAAGSA